MAVPLDKFVKQLEDSGILAGDTLKDFLPPKSEPKDAEELALELVRQKKLTKYQVEQISRGKGKSLVLGNYVILDKLGQGGMGMVLKARHTRMDRLVALKVMSSAAMKSPDAVQRFHREVKAAAKLEHPNIVTAYDADEALGTHFLVMQYVEGADLSALVKTKGPLSVGQTIRCITQAARGLEFAHQRGVIHRDIKPANLLLDNDGTVKILDMGLARIEGEVGAQAELTSTGAVMGTVDYMAPEQALSTKHADARSDIYSLGITLWYLLAGRSAYAGDTLMSRLLAHRDSPIPSLCVERGDVPTSVDSIFAKMVAKQPKDRYQSMTEVLRDLGQLHEGAPSAATPLSLGDSQLSGFGAGQTSEQAMRATATRPQLPTATYAPSLEAATEATILSGDLAQATIPQTLATGRSVVANASPAAMPLTGPASFWRDQRVQLGLLVAVLFVIAIPFLLSRAKERTDQSQLTSVQSSEGSTAPDSQSENNTPGESWHGWPLDAPKPAIAPFGTDQAKQHQAAWAKYLKVPVEYMNSIDMKFVLIPPGEFTMGSTSEGLEQSLSDAKTDPKQDEWIHYVKSEVPQHKVVLTKPFFLGVHEVTQKDFATVMGTNPSHFSATGQGKDKVVNLDTRNHPVETVDWNDAADFCAKLSQKETLSPFYFRSGDATTPLDGTGYRLPSEAEWEFACRAGTTMRCWFGNTDDELRRVGWFGGFSGERTHAVGELKPNPFGLFDNHGNISEWAGDKWDPTYYQQIVKSPAVDITGTSVGSEHVLRGGHWNSFTSIGTTSSRYASQWKSHFQGFRVALTVDAVNLSLKADQERSGPQQAQVPVPAQIPEPPPLEEWLKGRTILTVAQDGSGQFKTINEAIQQLRSGQVIKVMDRGPYREAIDLVSPPTDSGLISTQETVIELPNWLDDPEVGAGVRGHRISSTDGFRLSGLTWLSPPGEKGDLLRLWLINGLIMERCFFRCATKTAVLLQFDPQPRLQTAHIRECGFFDGLLLLGGDARHSRLVIENNYFHKRGSLLSWQVGRFGRLIFRHNVCDYYGPGFHGLTETSEGIELSNNTILAPSTQFSDAAPTNGVTIRNNIVRYGVLVSNSAGTLLPPAEWRVDHNGYVEYGKGNGKPFVAQSPTDVAQDPDFLSVDSSHRDYARIPADAPAGTAGAGGDWPGYLGALPPGPAPKEGDWFTRLQQRWLKPAAPPKARAANF